MNSENSTLSVVPDSIGSNITIKKQIQSIGQRGGKYPYFDVFEVEYGGQKAALKTTQNKMAGRRLANDSAWSEWLSRSDSPFTAPKVIATGNLWQLSEWIDGKYLTRHLLAQRHIDAVIGHLKFIDNELGAQFNQFYDKLVSNWQENIKKKTAIIKEKPEVPDELATELETQLLSWRWQRRLGHGDFRLKHIIVSREDNSKMYLFDGEHASIYQPRFYDLATFHVLNLTHSPELFDWQSVAGQVLSTDKDMDDFIAASALRCVFNLIDTSVDQDKYSKAIEIATDFAVRLKEQNG